MNKFALLAASALILAACNNQQPAAFNYTGNYTGTITDNTGGAGNVTLNITQNGNALTGTWTATFSNTQVPSNSGSLTGTVNGNAVTVNLASTQIGSCSFSATSSLGADGKTFTGSYATTVGQAGNNTTCQFNNGGQFTVVKQ